MINKKTALPPRQIRRPVSTSVTGSMVNSCIQRQKHHLGLVNIISTSLSTALFIQHNTITNSSSAIYSLWLRSHSFLIISFTLHHLYRGYKTRADLDICVPGHKALKAERIKLSHSKREGTLITGSAAVLFVLYTASRFVTISLQFHLDLTFLFYVTTYRTHVKLSSRIEGYSPSL